MDASLATAFMTAAVSGTSKTQVVRHFKEHYSCSPADIKHLIALCNFKSKPNRIDYLWFYNNLKEKTINWFTFPFTQLGVVEDFLSLEECKTLINAVNKNLRPSLVSNSDDSNKTSNYRTSQTSDLHYLESPTFNLLDKKICNFLGVNPFIGETIQSQKYEPGQYYKKHFDYFTPGTKEYKVYTEWMGQRTYTFMCYLNDVEEGGETSFLALNKKIKPKQGTAVIWNNLYKNGIPNIKTLHEACPPISGNKYVITKWFRSWSLI